MSLRRLRYLFGTVLIIGAVFVAVLNRPATPEPETATRDTDTGSDVSAPNGTMTRDGLSTTSIEQEQATVDAQTSAPSESDLGSAHSPLSPDEIAAPEDKQEEAPERLSRIKSVVDAILLAGSTGDESAAAAVCVDGSGVAQQASDFQAFLSDSGELVVDVYATTSDALAVSESVTARDRGKEIVGYLVFSLVRPDGKWLIDDIDFESHESGVGELDRFLEQHPDAELLKP